MRSKHKAQVLVQWKAELGKRVLQADYGQLYSAQNVAISGIHTHSGPAGYLQYLLYDITSLGFVQESFDALVDGIVLVMSCYSLGNVLL